MNKPREEIGFDGSRWIGAGPTYIVILKNGSAVLSTEGKSAERRALIKNFSTEVILGKATLTIDDLLFNADGVPPYAERVANLVHSIVNDVESEQEAKKILRQFGSVVIAAWRLAREPLGKSADERFRLDVMRLAQQFGRAPTKSEIRHAMFVDAEPENFARITKEITQFCKKNGLSWLPRGKSGRPRKKKDPPEL